MREEAKTDEDYLLREYEVDEVLDVAPSTCGTAVMFLMKWTGYSEPSWVIESALPEETRNSNVSGYLDTITSR